MRGERPGIKGVNSIHDIKVASFYFFFGGGGGGLYTNSNTGLVITMTS